MTETDVEPAAPVGDALALVQEMINTYERSEPRALPCPALKEFP